MKILNEEDEEGGRGCDGQGRQYHHNPQTQSDGTYFSRNEWNILSQQERNEVVHARARRHVDAIITGDTPTVISAITHHQDMNANQTMA